MMKKLILRFPRTGWLLAVALTGGILNTIAAGGFRCLEHSR